MIHELIGDVVAGLIGAVVVVFAMGVWDRWNR